MKRVIMAAAMVLLLASFGFAQTDSLSVHDITVGGIGQGCRGCHIPHGGSIKGSGVAARNTITGSGVADYTTGTFILWDKNLPQNGGGWATYTSSVDTTLAGAPLTATGDPANPVYHSFLCFSCHDGVTATINLGSVENQLDANSALLTGGSNGDADLTNDHPVDIPWPTTAAIVGKYDVTTKVNFIPGATNANTTFPTVQSLPLYGTNSMLECSTCHNPHAQPKTVSLTGVPGNFLRLNTYANNKDLCRTCHLDKR